MDAIDHIPDDNIECELTPDELATVNAKKLLKCAEKISEDRGEVASLIITIEKLEKDLEASESRAAILTVENYDLVERNKELVSIVNAFEGTTPNQVNNKVQLYFQDIADNSHSHSHSHGSMCVIS